MTILINIIVSPLNVYFHVYEAISVAYHGKISDGEEFFSSNLVF